MQFSKYSASGNDFIIFHTFKKSDFSNLAKRLCNRFDGLGADGLIVIIPHEKLDFEWLFYNSDGSSAKMCGNGTRACGLYAFENKLAGKKMRFLTGAGEISVEIFEDGVESELTEPKLLRDDIFEYEIKWTLIDTGVPHLITFLDELYVLTKEQLRELRHKYNANVNIGVLKDEVIEVRTFERGVEDETLACGTGMAALFYKAIIDKKFQNSAIIIPKSQERLIFRFEKNRIFFKGKVKRVFDTILYDIN